MQERRRTWISATGIAPPHSYGEGPGLGLFEAVDDGFARWNRSAPTPYLNPYPIRTGRGILSRRVAGDPLDFQEIIEAVFGVFPAIAGLLVAAERQPRVPHGIIDIDVA